MSKREIPFGIIGCGLMGREFASAAARWCHLLDLDFIPKIIGICDTNPAMFGWFEDNFTNLRGTTNYQDLLERSDIEAIYCAVPHDLHAQIYGDIIRAGKHLLGEKPFGIDHAANAEIHDAIRANPQVLVRCSSEFPFFPGAQRIIRFIREGRFGQIIEVEAGFHHSSDLDPRKPINWKRMIEYNGAYGCMGDLGMHVVHIPLRYGWLPSSVSAALSNIVTRRLDSKGQPVPCETWDNAILLAAVQTKQMHFPMTLSTKRIAPGEMNTWFIRIYGTDFSAEFSTKQPKTLRTLPYTPGEPQSWHVSDVGYETAYPTITGGIFEFGFPDAILQMWAAFCDELVNGESGMSQPFVCVTPEETQQSHRIFTAAIESNRLNQTIELSERA
jgi:predicted dehydrogenase